MSSSGEELDAQVARLVRDVPDFPEPGILFRDITPLLGDGPAFHRLVETWAVRHSGVDVVAGVEARGFILAAPLATRLGVGFVPVRKAGKLVDDVLATGGTAAAAAELVEREGGEVVAIQVLVALAALGGRDRLIGREVLATLTV
jgi:adenine phosphoribosyltransferase